MSEWVNPYRVYGGYTEYRPISSLSTPMPPDIHPYYYAFGFVEEEYAFDEVEATVYLAIEKSAIRTLYEQNSNYEAPRSIEACNTYFYAYREAA